MSKCSYKCLKNCQGLIFILNFLFFFAFGVAIVVVGSIDNFMMTTNYNLALIILGALSMISGLAGLLPGYCGLTKENRCCMMWHFIHAAIASFIIFVLLLTLIGLSTQVGTNLQNYCDGGSYNFNSAGFDKYDRAITNLGDVEQFCDLYNCPCALSSASPFEHRFSTYSDISSYQTHFIHHYQGGYLRMQDCKNLFQRWVNGRHANTSGYQDDKTLTNAFYMMRGIEEEFGCAGICYRSNVAIASESTNTVFMTNFNNGKPSCLEHVKDRGTQIFVLIIPLVTLWFLYTIVAGVFTMLFTFHKDLKEAHRRNLELKRQKKKGNHHCVSSISEQK